MRCWWPEKLETFRGVVENLAGEFDVMEVAAAAVKLFHDAQEDGGADEEQEIPAVTLAPERRPPSGPPSKGPRQAARPDRGPKRRADPREDGDITRIYIGAGRDVGMRPADLVGAIAGEAGIESSRIGTIQITDGYSLVEVPDSLADQIVSALRQATLRGRKVQVRRDRS